MSKDKKDKVTPLYKCCVKGCKEPAKHGLYIPGYGQKNYCDKHYKEISKDWD